MKKIYSIALLKKTELRSSQNEPIIISMEYDISDISFFNKTKTIELLKFITRTTCKKINNSTQKYQTINYNDMYSIYSTHNNNIYSIMITTNDYSKRIPFIIMNDLIQSIQSLNIDDSNEDIFLVYEPLKIALVKYQKPEEVDKIEKIKLDINSTIEILHKSIDSLLERGEKLEDLIEKSNDLSKSSQTFFKTAAKQNSCCVIL